MHLARTTTALTTLACLTLCQAAFAVSSDIKASNNEVTFQLMSTNVDYTETGGAYGVPPGTLDTETGSVPGYTLSVSKMQDWWLGNDYFEAEYDHAIGHTTYVGGYIGPAATPYGSVVGASTATLVNYSARYGAGIMLHDRVMLTNFAELGHHEWDRGVNLGETYAHTYFGIGALCQYAPTHGLVISASAMIGRMFGSNIAVNGYFSGALGDSSLYRVGVGADYALVQNVHGKISVDYMGFEYGRSGLYSGYFEPDSKTYLTTVKVGFGGEF